MGNIACLNDGSFGPAVRGCRGEFDFTIYFEQLVFSIIPAALFSLTAVWRVVTSFRRRKVVYAAAFGGLKLAVIALDACSKLALLVLAARSSIPARDIWIAARAVQFVAALCMLALSHIDHERFVKPSILLGLYVLATLLPDITQCRTFWLYAYSRNSTVIAGLFSSSLVLKLLVLLLEAKQKTEWIRWNNEVPHSPEETSGIYSIGLFSWLNRLFISGYCKPLLMQDLYPLDSAVACQRLFDRFQITAGFIADDKRSIGLRRSLVRTLWWALLLPVLPRAAMIGFHFGQAFLLNAVVALLSSSDEQSPEEVKYGLIGACILIYVGIAVATSLYWYFQRRLLHMVRGVLITAIYDKATRIQQRPESANAAVTLMSVDIERIFLGLNNIHELWASVVEVTLASWVLYNLVGASFIAAILVAGAAAAVIYVLTRFTGTAQRAWMSEVQRRVGLTAAMIAKMKSIRIAGLTEPIFNSIQDARVHELERSSRFRTLAISATATSFTTFTISPVLTFALAGRDLSSTKIYTSLALLTVMATSLYVALKSGPQFANAIICMGRIESYLRSEDREDFRSRMTEPKQAEPSDAVLDSIHQRTHTVDSFVVRNGTFAWNKETPVLSNININVPRSNLTIITGPVACGKSTLCQALLGEVPFHSGDVRMQSFNRIGYCEQSPFLANESIRQNIIGYSSFSSERYRDVIDATMLDIDFTTLPRGDHTVIGSNGIVLSGGQRQRVALARALYLQTDVLILDDVLRGLDANTEDQVFHRVFGPAGIVRQRNATAVLCTHSVRYLPFADHVVMLDSCGSVFQQGTFEELQEHPACVKDARYCQHVKEGVAAEDNSIATDRKSNAAIQTVLARHDDEASNHSAAKPRDADRDKEIDHWQRADDEVDTSDDERNVASHGQKIAPAYTYYIKSMGLPLAILQLFAAALFGFLYNFPTVWLQYWVNATDTADPIHTTSYYIGFYALLNICCPLSLLCLGYLVWVMTVRRAGANLHQDALRTLTHSALAYLTRTDQGVLTNLFSQDMNLLDTELANALLNTLMDLSTAVGQAAVLVAATPFIAVAYPILLAVLWVIQRFYLRTSRQLRMLTLESKSPLYTQFLDTTSAIVTLRAFSFMPEDWKKLTKILDESQRPSYLLYMVQEWLALVLNLVVAALATMVVSLALELRAGAGITGASLVMLISLGENVNSSVQEWTKLETSIGAVRRIRTFNETVPSEDKAGESVVPAPEWPPVGRVELRNVSATYESDPVDEKPHLALHDINLTISSGEKVAICGRTGSGKSSFVALLLKLLDPWPTAVVSSEILIDGIPLHTIDRAFLRQRIIALPQEAVLLPTDSSFRQNLDPLNLCLTPESCRQILELVDLWPAISLQPGGLEATMTATSLSHGQRQLFALAQAIVRRRARPGKRGILLLDEATSSVDGATERLMQKVIRDEFEGWTVLAVLHRLEMVLDEFDRVVVLEGGNVVEVGAPKVLVAQENSRFGGLWRAQRSMTVWSSLTGLAVGEDEPST